MADRRRPSVPVVHGDEREHRRQLAQAINALNPSPFVSEDVLPAEDADALIEAIADETTAETSPASDDSVLISDTSADDGRKMTLANLLKVINSLTAETAPAVDDVLALFDTSGSATDKITLADLLKVINGLTAKTSPASTDEVPIYDVAGAAAKKATITQFLSAVKATQAEMEAETADKYPDAALVRHSPGTAKAWVNFNGTGTVAIRDSYNVDSITDNGIGDYTINFTNAMPDVNYTPVGTSRWTTSGTGQSLLTIRSVSGALTTTGVRIGIVNSSSSALIDTEENCVAVLGNG